MAKEYKGWDHPLIPPPTYEQVAAEANYRNLPMVEALKSLKVRAEKVIAAEKMDPLRFGWEPTIWNVCDALIGLDFCSGTFAKEIKKRFGMEWPEWAEAMRQHLGFSQAITMLLILGANRSSKSEYSAKRGQIMLTQKPGSKVYAFHMSNPRSVRDQQPLFWKYMPPEYRHQQATANEYIKYKRKTGFSDNSFINPVESECSFLNYAQDRDTALEGMEADLVLPDELIPPDWVETILYRLTTRAGKGVIGFTPIRGYTPTVKIFCDSAKVVEQAEGYMLPRDGGEPDPARALGLSQAEFEEVTQAYIEKRPARAPQSRAQDCCAWLEGKTGQIAPPEGRLFEKMPRVLKCADPKLGVVFFHGCDNPYGNPKEVLSTAATKGPDEMRIRVYGKTDKTISNIFPKFNKDYHVLHAADIPDEGINYFFMDPASDRNFFMTWIRATREAAYIVREWPGGYHIPDIGVPDPWALPSGKKEGINDGRKGQGADSFGFGLLRYKFEIARLERWLDWRKWRDEKPNEEYPAEDDLLDWDEANGAVEVMEARLVDSRAASSPRVENDRPVTLYEDLQELGMDFSLAPGSSITDGISRINTALDFDCDAEQSFFNKPKLYVSDACPNTIYSMENWMNVDGQKGACKDPVDNVRYYYTAECGFVDGKTFGTRPGFYYGRGRSRRREPSDMPRPVLRGRRVEVRL